MPFLIKLLISAAIVIVTAWISPGVHIRSFWSAVIVALILALLNILLKPILVVFSIPITIITLGLFLFIINGFVVYVASKIVSGFHVNSLGSAIIYSILLSIISYIFGITESQIII